MRETILIHFSGHDKPGLTASLTRLLSDHNVSILDIGQAVVHEVLALGMLIEIPEGHDFQAVKSDLSAKCLELDLQVRFTTITPAALEHWIATQGSSRFLVTLLGRSITARQLHRVSTVIAENALNVDRIERLSTPLSLASHTPSANACVELRLSKASVQKDREDNKEAEMRSQLLHIAQDEAIDIAFQRESIFRRNRRLFAFDMDSTLIQCEVIDELAKIAGVADQVVHITAAAMRGEMEFKESFRRRVALLKGLPADKVYALLDTNPLVEGADRLVSTLKLLGYKTAILSGGFQLFGDHLQKRLNIDYVYCSNLEIANGVVTGEVKGTIVDGAKKAEYMQEIAVRESISLEQIVAVGDGANDLPMLKLAGMGIAFHAKPLVRASARHSLSHLGLDSLLYLIGVRDRDLAG